MKNKKGLLLVLALTLFLLTGCTVNYNANVEKNGSVKEEILILENDSFITEDYPFTKKEIVDKQVSEFKKDIRKGNYEYEYYENAHDFGVKLTKTYNSIAEYKNNIAINKAFKNVKIENHLFDTTIKAKHISCAEQETNCLYIDNLNITLNSDKLKSSNKKIQNNSVSWNFTNDLKDELLEVKIHNVNYSLICGIIAIIVLLIGVVLVLFNKKDR